jgi:hypothetical protein
MSRLLEVSISFRMSPQYFDWSGPNDEDMTDEEIMQYAKDIFYDDVCEYISSGELMDMINVEIIND